MNRLVCATKIITQKVLLPTTANISYQRNSILLAATVEHRQKVLHSTKTSNKMGSGSATIAIGQMRSTNDKKSNRDQVQEIIRLAVQQNAGVCIHFAFRIELPFNFSRLSTVCILARML